MEGRAHRLGTVDLRELAKFRADCARQPNRQTQPGAANDSSMPHRLSIAVEYVRNDAKVVHESVHLRMSIRLRWQTQDGRGMDRGDGIRRVSRLQELAAPDADAEFVTE